MKKRMIPILLSLVLLLSLIPVGFALADTTTEEEILQQRRQQVFDVMWDMGTVLWCATEDFTYTFATSTVNIKAGRLYRGIPYTHARGTYEAFMEYMGEADAKGVHEAIDLNPEMLSGSSLTARVGNDCSGAANSAYGSISPTIKQAGASTQVPANGFPRVALDKYVVKPSEDTNSDGKDVCVANGEQVMYSIYAEAQLADLWVCSGHTMMNHYVDVKYNDDGTINGEESTAVVVHQTPGYIRATTSSAYYTSGEFSEANYGEKVYKCFGVDEPKTFAWLYESGYMPVTCKELIDASPVEASTVSDSQTEHSYKTLLSGTISSNYQIDSVTMTITNENGVPLQQGTARCYRSDGNGTNSDMVYDLSRLRYENPEKMMGVINPNLLGVGNYHCRVDVRLFNGDVHEKVRDFDFAVAKDDLCEGWVDNSNISDKFAAGTTKAVCPTCGGEAVEWIPLPEINAEKSLIAGTHYYLTGDINNSSYYKVGGNNTEIKTCIHLNGHDLTSTIRVVQMAMWGRLHIMGNGKVVGGGTNESYGSTIAFASANAEVHLHGGTYGHAASTTRPTVFVKPESYANATVYLYGGATLCRMNGAIGPNVDMGNGYFYMKGGLITGGWNPDGNGGNIVIRNTLQKNFVVSGGIIAEGLAKYGGNVYITGSTSLFTMEGGEVYLGIAGYPKKTGAGGNIYVEDKGVVKLSGGTVSYGKAYNGGGNIFVKGGAKATVGGIVEKGNGDYGGSGSEAGGNIYLIEDGSSLTVTGTVRDNFAVSTGGNIFGSLNTNITIDGGTVSGGVASNRGGNVYITNTGGTLLIKNKGKVENGSAPNGGNVGTNIAATITLESGSITGGTASDLGNNIRLHANAKVSVADGVIDGGVYMHTGTLDLSKSASVGSVEFTTGKLRVDNGWTGSAGVKWTAEYGYGDTVASNRGACGTGSTFVAGGSYTGTLTYDGLETKPNIFGVNGALTVAGAQVVGNTTKWVVDNAAAVTAVQNGEYIKLYTDNALALTKDVYVDLNGHTVAASGTGVLYGMGDGSAAATCPVADTAKLEDCFVAIETDGVYTFHKLDMALNAVALRPSTAGVYYKVRYACDPVLAQRIGYRGIAMSVASMPTENFANEGHVIYTKMMGKPAFTDNAAVENSCILNNILTATTADENDENGRMPIFARPYIAIDKDGDGTADYTVVADTEQSGSYSLLDILKAVDANWAGYESQQQALKEHYATWKTWNVDWDSMLPNFAK